MRTALVIRVTRLQVWLAGAACCLLLIPQTLAAQDEIELANGTRLQGKIIERTEQSVKIQLTVEQRQLIRSFPLDRLRALTHNGERIAFSAGAASTHAPAAFSANNASADFLQRSPEAVQALIEEMGRTPPDWFDSVPLEFPKTLDLTWPEPAPVIWNYTRNIDHYIWDIINTNPNRYRGGIRLMHHLLAVNQKNPRTLTRVMNELGRMYFEFFNDYARAAFWWRQAKVDTDPLFATASSGAQLAECYWRLGSRPMAMTLLERLPLNLAVIKIWGDLKETEKALGFCETALKKGFLPSQVLLLSGDVCRAGRNFTRAAEYYRQVLQIEAAGKDAEQIKRDQDRAQATLEVIRLFDTLDVSRIPDGAYQAKSLGYSGHVEMEATVQNGRISALRVLHHSDRQYYHAIEETIRRIMVKQTVQGVDAISGATVTSEAVIRASAKALAEGMHSPAGSPAPSGSQTRD